MQPSTLSICLLTNYALLCVQVSAEWNNWETGIKIEGIMADSTILSQELCWGPEE